MNVTHFSRFALQNVYLSKQGCTNHTPQGGVAYIGIPDPIESEPYLASLNGRSGFQKWVSFPEYPMLIYICPTHATWTNVLTFLFGFLREIVNGFLLHRVSSLEIVCIQSFFFGLD